jgi:hypothetical protein
MAVTWESRIQKEWLILALGLLHETRHRCTGGGNLGSVYETLAVFESTVKAKAPQIRRSSA